MSDPETTKLSRSYKEMEGLSAEQRRAIDCYMLGWLSAEVSEETWDAALAAAMKALKRGFLL